MTPRQKALIRRSWSRLGKDPESTTALFYQRLFATNPNSRRLFRNKDMRVQGLAFSQMLALFLRSLDEKEPEITETIRASGHRHVGYGVMYSDYVGAGEALLWALEQQFGASFDPEVREAWAEAYRTLAATMRQGSSSVL